MLGAPAATSPDRCRNQLRGQRSRPLGCLDSPEAKPGIALGEASGEAASAPIAVVGPLGRRAVQPDRSDVRIAAVSRVLRRSIERSVQLPKRLDKPIYEQPQSLAKVAILGKHHVVRIGSGPPGFQNGNELS